LILQERACGEVQVGSGGSQERIGRIARKACFKF
jgi:hypothetical protein